MRDSLLDALRHPLAKKAYTLAAVVFAVAAVMYHQQPEIGYQDRIARWGLPAGAAAYTALRAWAAGGHHRTAALAAKTATRAKRLPATDVYSEVTRTRVVGVCIAMLVVTSAFAGFVGPASLAGKTQAQTNGFLLDDFEDGDLNGWSGGNGKVTTSNASKVIEGQYSVVYDDLSTDGSPFEQEVTDSKYSSISWQFKAIEATNKYDGFFIWENTDGGSQVGQVKVQHNSTNGLYIEAKGASSNFIHDVSVGDELKFTMFPDYSNNTFFIRVEDLETGDVYKTGSVGFKDGAQSTVGQITWTPRQTHSTFDYVTFNQTQKGVKVSGEVTSGGSAVSGATVELLQSGSVTDSATTASDGSYSFSGVSDGDYTIRASASGYQNASSDITVSGSAVSQDLSLYEAGTYRQAFYLKDNTGAFPKDETVLELYEYQPLDQPIGQSPWERVETSQLNSESVATFRLTEDELYRVTAKNVVPNQRSAEQTWSGFEAGPDLPEPYVLETVGVQGIDDTADGTPTATPGPDATPYPEPDLPNPNEDDDGDGDPNWSDPDDDGDGTPDGDETPAPGETPSGPDEDLDTYGPTYLSSCELSNGQGGARIQYYDPTYSTTSLTYNVQGPDGVEYSGNETFDAPIGLWTECVAGTLTNNVTDGNSSDGAAVNGTAGLTDGSSVGLDTDFQASGPGFTSFAPMGDPADTPAEQGTIFLLTAAGVGLSYLASRRTNVLSGLSERLPVDPVFVGGSAVSVLLGLEFASGGAVSAAFANGLQRVAPLAGLAAVGYGAYWVYTTYIQGQNVTLRRE